MVADDSFEGGFCIPANVAVNNEEHPRFTKLFMEVRRPVAEVVTFAFGSASVAC